MFRNLVLISVERSGKTSHGFGSMVICMEDATRPGNVKGVWRHAVIYHVMIMMDCNIYTGALHRNSTTRQLVNYIF